MYERLYLERPQCLGSYISAAWLETGELQRVVLVILDQATSEPLERWNFIIEADKDVLQKGY